MTSMYVSERNLDQDWPGTGMQGTRMCTVNNKHHILNPNCSGARDHILGEAGAAPVAALQKLIQCSALVLEGKTCALLL